MKSRQQYRKEWLAKQLKRDVAVDNLEKRFEVDELPTKKEKIDALKTES